MKKKVWQHLYFSPNKIIFFNSCSKQLLEIYVCVVHYFFKFTYSYADDYLILYLVSVEKHEICIQNYKFKLYWFYFTQYSFRVTILNLRFRLNDIYSSLHLKKSQSII